MVYFESDADDLKNSFPFIDRLIVSDLEFANE